LLRIRGIVSNITLACTPMSIDTSGKATIGMPTPMAPFTKPATMRAHTSATISQADAELIAIASMFVIQPSDESE
jgi:hypothetical protein